MTNLILDPKFEKGFAILRRSLLSDNHSELLSLPFHNGNPTYRLAEYFTKDDLYHERDIRVGDGTYSISNRHKNIVRDTQGRLTLAIYCGQEYDHPRQEGEPWPHLLIEQEFGYHPIAKAKKLLVELDLDFLSLESHMDSSWDGELHTCQVSLYFAIGDGNPDSKGYKDFFWFGLPLIDLPRLHFPKSYCSRDLGKEDATRKLIYSIDPHIYLGESLLVGERADVNLDIRGYIDEGFAKAKELGYLTEVDRDDLCLFSMNLGFEATGAFDGKIRINKLNVFEEEWR